MTSGLRDLTDLDRIIHEPARLMIVSLLYVSRDADFVFLQRETGLTKGNLSSHLVRLEAAGYVHIEKMFRGKLPLTLCRLTDTGRAEFENYRKTVKRALRR
jgi:DNA-binding transcriptional ArsR family regulator